MEPEELSREPRPQVPGVGALGDAGAVTIYDPLVTHLPMLFTDRSPGPSAWGKNWKGTWQSLLMSAQAQNKQVMMFVDGGICNANYEPSC